jgi:anti-sigma regulatory factor (Ser/Thr protein kinase)
MAVAAEVAAELCNFWECDLTVRLQLSVALEEALTNAYFYGSLGMDASLKSSDPARFYELAEERKNEKEIRDRRIWVSARFSRDRATFVVADEGQGFDVEAVMAEADEQDLDSPHGRGVRLMKTFMDQVSYHQRGNQVTLTKHRPAAEAN